MMKSTKVKAGGPPPSGYIAWHEWAEIQDKAGLKQVTCGQCGLWRFPQELSGNFFVSEAETSDGTKVKEKLPICLKCNEIPRKPKRRTAKQQPLKWKDKR